MEMEMEMEEIINLDVMFDPEMIYSNISQPIILSSYDHRASTNQQIMSTTSINSWDSNYSYGAGQENKTIDMIITNPSISSSSYSVVAPPKLISFESSNTLLDINVSTNSDTARPNDDDDDHEMSVKGYCCYSPNNLINFSSGKDDDDDDDDYAANEALSRNTKVMTTGRTMLQARDHVMAERKRRENLSQLFVSLSKVVPGLKKLDKASLLEDAINHLKALQERVSVLEKETSASMDEEIIGSINNGRGSESGAAEIKARINSDKQLVLIHIHCKKQKGLMSRVPCQLEKMHLSVLDMRIMPFGGQAHLHITLLAQMQSEFQGTVKDIVDQLHTLLSSPIV